MIRKYLAVASLLLAAACSKAPEDATAHYSMAGGAGTITAKASAKGDFRLDAGPQTLLHKDGVDYIIFDMKGEKFAVSFKDFIAANQQLMTETGAKPKPRTENPEFDATEVGEETIAGQKGAIWRIQPKEKGGAGDSVQVVVDKDSSYAGIGKAVLMQATLRSEGMKQLTGSESNVEKRLSEVLSKGMPLRIGEAMTLQDVSKGPIPAADFTLPKQLNKDELYKRMKESMAAQAGAAGAPEGAAPAPGEAPAPAPSASPSPAAK